MLTRSIVNEDLQEMIDIWMDDNDVSASDVSAKCNYEISASTIRQWRARGIVSKHTVKAFLGAYGITQTDDWLKFFVRKKREKAA